MIVVVGAGGAGLSAAIEAHDAGASVLVLEAAAQPGGATAMSAGVIYAAGTDAQRRAGITDSTEDLFRHYMGITHHFLEPRLVRALLEGTHDAIAWLEDLGVPFPPEGLHNGGVDPVLRSHLPTPRPTDLGPSGGATIATVLLDEVLRRGIEVRVGTRVSALVTRDGRVAGVRTESGDELEAAGVVLAAGGIGHDREQLAQLFPRAGAHQDGWYIGPETVRGDGVRLGEAVGADVVIGDGVVLATPDFERKLPDGFLPPYLVLVNAAGRRFVDETAPYSELPDAIDRQPGARCWAILDHRGFSGAGDDPALSDPHGYGVGIASNWTSETLAAERARGKVLEAATLPALGELAGISPQGLATAIAAYNHDVKAGGDRIFEKQGPLLAIEAAPFYAVELRCAALGVTFSGLRIDQDGRVIDNNGTPIPGLAAAGETTGGVQGLRYVASGACVGNAVAFGRRAGRTLARDTIARAADHPVGVKAG